MANLIPVSRNDDIVMLELSDFVKGGQNGKSNEQAQQLLNKYTWFNNYLYSAENTYDLLKTNKVNDIQSKKNALILKIELLKGKSDVADVVATYADLLLYDTSTLYDNNIVKVLADETHSRMCTYYRWHTSTQTFSFIGVENVIMPIMISSDTTVNPDDNYTYVVNNAVLTVNSGYDGCIITVVAATACSVVYSSNTYQCHSGEVIKLYYINNTWFIYEYDILNMVYPVGTVYISYVNVSPAALLGGTWEYVTSGKVLVTSGETYNTGTTGGNNSIDITFTGSISGHSIVLSELPSHGHANQSWNTGGVSQNHAHTYQYTSITFDNYGYGRVRWRRSTGSQTTGGISANHQHKFNVASGGVTGANGTAHSHPLTMDNPTQTVDIRQRSINVFMWRRTA